MELYAGSITATSVGVSPIAQNYNISYTFTKTVGYSQAIAICDLQSGFETSMPRYGRHSIITRIVSATQNGLMVSAQTLLPGNNIGRLKIRYMALEPSFTYIAIANL